ncbi:MAG: DJ-1/PfpI family protein [Clostridiales bacterium]|nr:DJ-1/PfpI family protein [Clostridiales bacterium]
MEFSLILFDQFETLDAFGPAEIAGMLPERYQLDYFSREGGLVTSVQNIRVMTRPFRELGKGGVILIPGGIGTRKLIKNEDYIADLKKHAGMMQYVLTVCTGSALLAKTGLLDGKEATSNKRVFDWVTSVNQQVKWIRQARWVVDGKFYTASGVTAGMDMMLGFISDRDGIDAANEIAQEIEYLWNTDRTNDPFANGTTRIV